MVKFCGGVSQFGAVSFFLRHNTVLNLNFFFFCVFSFLFNLPAFLLCFLYSFYSTPPMNFQPTGTWCKSARRNNDALHLAGRSTKIFVQKNPHPFCKFAMDRHTLSRSNFTNGTTLFVVAFVSVFVVVR